MKFGKYCLYLGKMGAKYRPQIWPRKIPAGYIPLSCKFELGAVKYERFAVPFCVVVFSESTHISSLYSCELQLISSTTEQFSDLTLLHSERPKLHSFGRSECNRVNNLI